MRACVRYHHRQRQATYDMERAAADDGVWRSAAFRGMKAGGAKAEADTWKRAAMKNLMVLMWAIPQQGRENARGCKFVEGEAQEEVELEADGCEDHPESPSILFSLGFPPPNFLRRTL